MSGDQRERSGWALQSGFTLIELLVVIIIIAILAAIAIPTFLGEREKAEDVAAVTLVRNALTVVESANIDTRDYSAINRGGSCLLLSLRSYGIFPTRISLILPRTPR